MATKKPIRKLSTHKNHPLVTNLNFRSPAMLAAVTILALSGIYIVMQLLAAQIAAFEAEGTRTGNVAIISDPGASGGQYIQFGSTGTTTPPPATPPPATPPPPTPPPANPPPPISSGNKCVVGLAGSGGGYGMTAFGSDGYYPQDSSWTTIDTLGNSPYSATEGGWNPNDYTGAIAAINRDISAKQPVGGCGQIIVHGFSSGGGMAGEMACRGETLGGRVIGYIDDDGVGFPSTSCSTGSLKVRVFGCTMSGPNNYYINYFHYGDTPGEAAILGTNVVDKPAPVCNNQTSTQWHTPYSKGDLGGGSTGALPPEYFSWW
jgi:hypothetical protein